MQPFIGELFGVAGGLIGVGSGLPQVWRIRKLGYTDGLAVSPWVLTAVMMSGWVAFGVLVASPSILIFNALSFVTSALVVTAVKGNTFKLWAQLILLGAAAFMFVYFAPPVISNIFLVTLTGSRLPQLIKTWFNRKSTKPTAVSLASMVVQLSSVSCWLAFAFLTSNGLVVATSLVFMAIVLATYFLESHIARRARLAAG